MKRIWNQEGGQSFKDSAYHSPSSLQTACTLVPTGNLSVSAKDVDSWEAWVLYILKEYTWKKTDKVTPTEIQKLMSNTDLERDQFFKSSISSLVSK